MLQNTLDFYKILVGIAQGTPPVISAEGYEVRCKRIQSLAIVNDIEAVANTDTLGKDSRHIAKGVYYSSDWYAAGQSPNYIAKAPYPQLLLGAQRERLTQNSALLQVTYTLVFIDKANEAQSGEPSATVCSTRTEEEVEADLRRLYLQFVANIRDIVFCSLTSTAFPAASFSNKWVSQAWLDAYELTDTTARVDIHDHLSNVVNFDAEASFSKELGTSDTYAYISTLRVDIPNCAQANCIVPPISTDTLQNTPCC